MLQLSDLDNDSEFITDVLSRFDDLIFDIIMTSAAFRTAFNQKLQRQATKLNGWSFLVFICVKV